MLGGEITEWRRKTHRRRSCPWSPTTPLQRPQLAHSGRASSQISKLHDKSDHTEVSVKISFSQKVRCESRRFATDFLRQVESGSPPSRPIQSTSQPALVTMALPARAVGSVVVPRSDAGEDRHDAANEIPARRFVQQCRANERSGDRIDGDRDRDAGRRQRSEARMPTDKTSARCRRHRDRRAPANAGPRKPQRAQSCRASARSGQAHRAPTPIDTVVKGIGPERAMNGLDQML